MKGVVISGTHSGCGKTTVTLGLLAALKKRGLNVQSFKAGPDFIDAGLHKIITGRPSRNLDLWMCGENGVRMSFNRHSHNADISVVEGVMGLYDGRFSTATLANALNLPVLLVVDAYGMAESAGAVVRGFREYRAAEQQSSRATEVEPFTTELLNCCATELISGVIFNRVASENHFKRLKEGVHDVPVLGYLPRDLNFEIPHRHLGLIVAEENPIAEDNIKRLADTVLEYVDVDAILSSIPSFNSPLNKGGHRGVDLSPSSIKIALAYDKAFCFYYEDNLDLLREAGADIVKFSPISDKSIPEGADAVYIGGGYPELYAMELSGNTAMLRSIYEWSNSGKPIYAECGGLMYLSQGIHDFDGIFFQMAGVFPFETRMKKGRSHLGYREIQLNEDCILGRKGDKCRGHEFHYSEMGCRIQDSKVYSLRDGSGQAIGNEGCKFKNTLASYVHIHFGSNPGIAGNFVDFIKENRVADGEYNTHRAR